MIFADAAAGDVTVQGIIQIVLQGGAFGLLVYIVIFAFPRWNTENRNERQEQRENFLAALREQNISHKEQLDTINVAIKDQTTQIRDKLTEVKEAFGSDPGKICQAAQALREAGIVCKIDDALRYAEIILKERERRKGT